MQNLDVLASKMAELLQFHVFSKKISFLTDRPTFRQTDRQSDLYYPLVADKKQFKICVHPCLKVTDFSVIAASLKGDRFNLRRNIFDKRGELERELSRCLPGSCM